MKSYNRTRPTNHFLLGSRAEAFTSVSFFVASVLLLQTSAATASNDCSLPESGVSASISPISIKNKDERPTRFIEIFWWGMNTSLSDDWLGVWFHDPLEDMSDPIETSPFSGELDGHSASSVKYDPSTIPDDVTNIVGSTCLPYWVGYVQNNAVIHSDCLKIHPHWMNNMKDIIKDSLLTDILLPGVHDAGASTWYQDWWADGFIGDIVSQWAVTQDESFWQQLVLGVRYFDMRIAYYPEKEFRYYINHGDVIMAPLYLYLEDIARFMSQTNEIVIFDIRDVEHKFWSYPLAAPGLHMLLDYYLGEYSIPNKYEQNSTLGLLWSTSRNLIITYPSSIHNEMYWHSVSHVFGSVNTMDELYEYFDEAIPDNAGRSSLWSAMTEFTATAIDVTLNRWGGLTGAANITNLPVTLRLRRDWWSQVNIIAMDFASGSGIIDIVVKANLLKLTCAV